MGFFFLFIPKHPEAKMRGGLSIKAGTYHLTSSVDLTLSLSDAGTVVRLDNLLPGNGCTVIIDENGQIVHREVHNGPKSQKASLEMPSDSSADSPLPAVSPVAHPTSPEKQTAHPTKPKKRSPKRIRFVLQYGQRSRVRSRPIVLGGFMDGRDMSILYHTVGGMTQYEGQLLITGDIVVRGDRIPKHQRLPREEWDRFLEHPEDQNFRLSIATSIWRKMAHEKIRPIIAGRTLKLTE
jgi:hypothetical protein